MKMKRKIICIFLICMFLLTCLTTVNAIENRPDEPEISGPQTGLTKIPYTYTVCCSNTYDGADISYYIDWDYKEGDEFNHWDDNSEVVESGGTVTFTHIWNIDETGEHTIRVAAASESTGLIGDFTTYDVEIFYYKPSATGAISGKTNTDYEYTIEEPYDWEKLDDSWEIESYYFDWGDGTNSGWQESDTASHNWSSKGTYSVSFKVKDNNDIESEWLVCSVDITKAKSYNSVLDMIENMLDNFDWPFPILRVMLWALGK
jgi:hypothetical protein